jgi:hypothetical protein
LVEFPLDEFCAGGDERHIGAQAQPSFEIGASLPIKRSQVLLQIFLLVFQREAQPRLEGLFMECPQDEISFRLAAMSL